MKTHPLNRGGKTPLASTPSSDPSAWSARLSILALAFAGLCIASYLAAYQLGMVKSIWEPIFCDGSQRVLHSFISRVLPIPDAVLGAVGYFAELVTGVAGGRQRWRKMPWLVLIYGAVVALIAATAVILVFVQALIIRAGCTLCLLSALISIVIAWRARHEVLPSAVLLRHKL